MSYPFMDMESVNSLRRDFDRAYDHEVNASERGSRKERERAAAETESVRRALAEYGWDADDDEALPSEYDNA